MLGNSESQVTNPAENPADLARCVAMVNIRRERATRVDKSCVQCRPANSAGVALALKHLEKLISGNPISGSLALSDAHARHSTDSQPLSPTTVELTPWFVLLAAAAIFNFRLGRRSFPVPPPNLLLADLVALPATLRFAVTGAVVAYKFVGRLGLLTARAKPHSGRRYKPCRLGLLFVFSGLVGVAPFGHEPVTALHRLVRATPAASCVLATDGRLARGEFGDLLLLLAPRTNLSFDARIALHPWSPQSSRLRENGF